MVKCACGCGRLRSRYDSCGKIRAFIPGHNARKSIETRLFEKITMSNDCWEWTGAKNDRGYGVIGIGKKLAYAHRVSWEIHNGPITGSIQVLHRCDNPSCTRPDHLFLGTQMDNIKDMHEKGRAIKALGEENGRSKLTASDVREIRKLSMSGMTNGKIGEIYGVKHAAIQSVLSGRTWSHMREEDVKP